MNALTRWMKARLFNLPVMITCQEAEAFIADYLDGDLPDRKRKVFEWHLRLCRECRDYLDAYRRTIALGKAALDDPDAPAAELPEDLVKAILEARDA